MVRYGPAFGNWKSAHERDRHVGHDHAGEDGDDRRADLAKELPLRAQVEDVVQRAHEGDQDGSGEHHPGVHDAAVSLV